MFQSIIAEISEISGPHCVEQKRLFRAIYATLPVYSLAWYFLQYYVCNAYQNQNTVLGGNLTYSRYALFNKELKNHDKIAYQNQNIWSKLLLQYILEKTLISRILNFKVKEKIIIVVQNGLAGPSQGGGDFGSFSHPNVWQNS